MGVGWGNPRGDLTSPWHSLAGGQIRLVAGGLSPTCDQEPGHATTVRRPRPSRRRTRRSRLGSGRGGAAGPGGLGGSRRRYGPSQPRERHIFRPAQPKEQHRIGQSTAWSMCRTPQTEVQQPDPSPN